MAPAANAASAATTNVTGPLRAARVVIITFVAVMSPAIANVTGPIAAAMAGCPTRQVTVMHRSTH